MHQKKLIFLSKISRNKAPGLIEPPVKTEQVKWPAESAEDGTGKGRSERINPLKH